MSQNDLLIGNQGFAAFRSDLNSALQALGSNSSGDTEPTTTYAYQTWSDSTTDTLKIRNQDNDAWIIIGTFDQATDSFIATIDANAYLAPDGDGSQLTGIVAGLAWAGKTSAYTAANNDAIIANTSGGSFTITLPSGPSEGDVIRIVDGGDWATNNLTVARNGSSIEGDAADLVMNIGGVSVDFVYDGSTWQIYTQVGVSSGTVVTEAGTQTLTNKTLTSVVMDGTPTAPTAAAATNTTQVATTAFVLANGSAVLEEVLATTVVSTAVSSIDFTFDDSLYHSVRIEFINLKPTTNNQFIVFKTSTDDGSSFDSGSSDYRYVSYGERDDLQGTYTNFSTSDGKMIVSPRGLGSGTNEGSSGFLYVMGPSESTYTQILGNSVVVLSGGMSLVARVAGQRLAASNVNGVQLSFLSGTIASGTIRMIGVLK